MSKLRIKAILKMRGLTTKNLAEMMNVTPQYLSGVLNEKNSPTLSTLVKIAECLEVPVSSLFEDSLEENKVTILCPHCGGRIDLRTGRQK